MAVTFVVVPQWQGSGSSRALRLVDGAEAIRSDLPAAVTRVVEVPLEAGDEQGSTVHRLSSIALVRDRLLETLGTVSGVAITIGGDCGVELGAIDHARAAAPDAAVVWFDAHPDLNTAAASPSHAFGGMVLRTLIGDGPATLVPAVPVAPERVILAGVRAFDPDEVDYLDAHTVTVVAPDSVTGEVLIAAVEATGATSVYLHIDLDVLDPSEFNGLGAPQPFGVAAGTLVDSVRTLLARFPLAGAGIMGFAPSSPSAAADDLPTILRIVGALASST